MNVLSRAAEYVRHLDGCPAIGGAGDDDCTCGAVAFLDKIELLTAAPEEDDDDACWLAGLLDPHAIAPHGDEYNARIDRLLERLNRTPSAVVSLSEAFEMGYSWAMGLRGQTLEDSRAVGRTLFSDLFEPIKDLLDTTVFNSFEDADHGIAAAKRIINAALDRADGPVSDKLAMLDSFGDYTTPQLLIEVLADAREEMDYSNFHTNRMDLIKGIIRDWAKQHRVPMGPTKAEREAARDAAQREEHAKTFIDMGFDSAKVYDMVDGKITAEELIRSKHPKEAP